MSGKEKEGAPKPGGKGALAAGRVDDGYAQEAGHGSELVIVPIKYFYWKLIPCILRQYFESR
jgi:hypothetical protein